MAEENNAAAAAGEQENVQQVFQNQRVYLKDLSYEAPMGAEAFRREWKPQVNQELNTKTNKVADDVYEVVLGITVTVKLEDQVAFLVEVQQAGLFTIKGLENQQLAHVMNTLCPQILFPYAREAIDNAVVKGSFPALMLPPVNFDALFAQAVAQAKSKAEQEGQAEGTIN